MTGYASIIAPAGIAAAERGLAELGLLADDLTEHGSGPTLVLWRSQHAVLVTRRDTDLPGFAACARRMAAAGWPVIVRKSGGGACPIGPGTLQAATIEAALPGTSIDTQYDALTALLQFALRGYGVTARSGTVAGAYCPGRYDLAVAKRKITGLSQHWFRNAAGIRCVITTASINIAEEPAQLADITNSFHASAGSDARCDPDALTNLRSCGGATIVAASDPVAAFALRLAAAAATTSAPHALTA